MNSSTLNDDSDEDMLNELEKVFDNDLVDIDTSPPLQLKTPGRVTNNSINNDLPQANIVQNYHENNFLQSKQSQQMMVIDSGSDLRNCKQDIDNNNLIQNSDINSNRQDDDLQKQKRIEAISKHLKTDLIESFKTSCLTNKFYNNGSLNDNSHSELNNKNVKLNDKLMNFREKLVRTIDEGHEPEMMPSPARSSSTPFKLNSNILYEDTNVPNLTIDPSSCYNQMPAHLKLNNSLLNNQHGQMDDMTNDDIVSIKPGFQVNKTGNNMSLNASNNGSSDLRKKLQERLQRNAANNSSSSLSSSSSSSSISNISPVSPMTNYHSSPQQLQQQPQYINTNPTVNTPLVSPNQQNQAGYNQISNSNMQRKNLTPNTANTTNPDLFYQTNNNLQVQQPHYNQQTSLKTAPNQSYLNMMMQQTIPSPNIQAGAATSTTTVTVTTQNFPGSAQNNEPLMSPIQQQSLPILSQSMHTQSLPANNIHSLQPRSNVSPLQQQTSLIGISNNSIQQVNTFI